MGGAFVVGLGVAVLILREPTEPLTADSLHAARQLWREAAIDDYTLRYRMHGSEYAVIVRDDIVTEVTVNGQTPTSVDYRAYDVSGLFDTLEAEIENVTDPHGPFGGRPGAVLMRVRFNARLGYIERYLRSAGGHGRGAAIELIDFSAIE